MGKKQSVKQDKNKKKAPRSAFKPGISGNPKGRPPLGESVSGYFRDALKEIDPKLKKEKIACIFDRAYSGAMSKKPDANRWAQFIFDRAFGKPLESIDVGNKDGKPFEITQLSPEDRKKRLEELRKKQDGNNTH